MKREEVVRQLLSKSRERIETLQRVESKEFKEIWSMIEEKIDVMISGEFSLVKDPGVAASTTGHAKCNGAVGVLFNIKSIPSTLLKAEQENAARLLREYDEAINKANVEEGNREARDYREKER